MLVEASAHAGASPEHQVMGECQQGEFARSAPPMLHWGSEVYRYGGRPAEGARGSPSLPHKLIMLAPEVSTTYSLAPRVLRH